MLSKSKHLEISKLMSYVLRHNPSEFGLTLSLDGWIGIEDFIKAINAKSRLKYDLTRELVEDVAKNCEKQRFKIDGDRIRASQGHSVEVSLDYKPITPPDVLYHGTSTKALESIKKTGIQKMERHHVHLSTNLETASKVGSRHGKLIVLIVNSKAMHDDGHKFYCSDNGVWLTDHVPANYISKW